MKSVRSILLILLIIIGHVSCATPRPVAQSSENFQLSRGKNSRERPRRPWNFAELLPPSLSEELLEAIQDFVPPHLPSIWPAQGWVSSGFGMRFSPIHQEPKFHAGIDIAAPLGSPIFATADGIVTFAGNRGGYGRALVLDHGLGLSTLYAHASKSFSQEGEWVRKGQIIAAVGRSGDATGPHLHYEVHLGGRPKDPIGYGLKH